MADDIVNRIHQRLWRAPAEYHALLRDAADEIKRLQSRCVELEQQLKYWEGVASAGA